MQRIVLAGLAALSLSLGASAALANVIDFDSLPAGDAANPLVLPGATFTTAGGFNFIIGGNQLCPSPNSGSGADCSLDLQVDFDAPSSGISFTYLYNNDHNVGDDIGDVKVFAGATLLGTADVLVADTDPFTKDLVDLSAFGGVTRLVISSTDFGGVGYDDFTFTSGVVRGGVPEPAAWAMMIAGFGLTGAMLRSRRRFAATA
jgi:hypothetical protein